MIDEKEIDIFKKNPFLGIRNTGYYRQKKGWRWESRCDYACLYCVTEGEICLTLKGSKMRAECGDVIFLRSRDEEAELCSDRSDAAYYFVSFYFDEDVSLGIAPLVKGSDSAELFKELSRTHHSEAYLYKLKSSELFLRLIYQLALSTARRSKTYTRSSGLRAAVEYVNTYYYKKITIRELCAVSNYSPAHLRRLFTENYGLSPQEYIINKKLSIAAEMITDAPEKTIDEIAELLSFCSSSYLCKLFKKRYGVSILGYKSRQP